MGLLESPLRHQQQSENLQLGRTILGPLFAHSQLLSTVHKEYEMVANTCFEGFQTARASKALRKLTTLINVAPLPLNDNRKVVWQ